MNLTKVEHKVEDIKEQRYINTRTIEVKEEISMLGLEAEIENIEKQITILGEKKQRILGMIDELKLVLEKDKPKEK